MIDTHPQPTTRLSHLRAYLAGTGATGSLIAGTVVVLLSLAAFVAYKGLPFGNSGGSFGSAYLGAKAVGPPEAAGRTLAAASRSVAASPVPGAPAGAGGLQNSNPAGAPSANTTTTTTSPLTVGTTPPTTTTPAPPSDTGSGPITNVVDGVGGATGQDPSSGTSQVTQQLDNTLTTTLNNTGAVVGNPTLGSQVDQTLNDATGGLLHQGSGSGGN